MKKLDFYIEPHDSFLQADTPDGFVMIFNSSGVTFSIKAYHNLACVVIAEEVDNLYDALDKANEWWNSVN